MTDTEIWEKSTGRPLTLGQKVKIVDENEYKADWCEEYFITGLEIEKDGKKVNVTIGDDPSRRDADGWSIHDLLPVF